MQMRCLYQSVNKAVRAAKLRADAKELTLAGFADFARIARQEADIIDPPPIEEAPKRTRVEKPARINAPRVSGPHVPNVRPVPVTTRPDPVARAQRSAQRHPSRLAANIARPTSVTPFRPSRAVGIR